MKPLNANWKISAEAMSQTSQEEVCGGAEVQRAVAAAEGVDADRNQADADGRQHNADNDRREQLFDVFVEAADDHFDKATDDTSAQQDAVRIKAAAQQRQNADVNAKNASVRAHDDGQLRADLPDGVQLEQGDDTGNEHRIAEDRDMDRGTAGNAADTQNNDRGSQVADKHGKHVLHAKGDGRL